MKTDLASAYDLKVPRYTSYPTVPHFNEAVDGARYSAWLDGIDPGTLLSLYFHIPFCAEMCWFCGCHTKIVKRYDPVAAYVETLLAEIDLVAAALPGRFAARHLHWGGGSPSMLKGADWRRIMDKLAARFDIAPGARVAVEIDPRTATEDYVKTLAGAGVNRASIGVQDFDADVQAAINRVQLFAMTERVVGWLRAHGIANLNMDLMYGLPHQTVPGVKRMADQAAILEPDRLALFGYAHVPWMKPHQKMIPEDALPDTPQRLSQFEAAAARLGDHGYVAIGLDHFALPGDDLAIALKEGRLRRNFQGYTTDTAPVLLGLGASAIGALPQGYVQNTAPLKDYRRGVERGELPVTRGIALTPEDRLRGEIIERLMCGLAADLGAIGRRHGADPGHFAAELDALTPLADDGIVTVDGERVTVTPAGRPFTRLVASTFDTYLHKGAARHSKVV
jgi:oxygen-independent coproporphyrinogen-3 oxidase